MMIRNFAFNFNLRRYIQVLVLSPKGFAAESFNMLDPLAGQYGFDGGMLPGGRRERVGPGGCCSPRHPTHFEPSSLESHSAL